MNEEEPLDLQGLEPPEPADQAKQAIKRFRWRVVLLTVAVLILVTAATLGGVKAYEGQQRHIADLEDWAMGPQSQIAIAGGTNCKTPTYKVGYADVTLLQSLEHPDGWVLHVVVQGNGHPLAVFDHAPGAGIWKPMTIVPDVAGAAPARVLAQDPRWRMAEAYVEVPGAPRQFRLQLNDPSGAKVGTLTANMDDVMC